MEEKTKTKTKYQFKSVEPDAIYNLADIRSEILTKKSLDIFKQLYLYHIRADIIFLIYKLVQFYPATI